MQRRLVSQMSGPGECDVAELRARAFMNVVKGLQSLIGKHLKLDPGSETHPQLLQILCQRNNVSLACPTEIPWPDLQRQCY